MNTTNVLFDLIVCLVFCMKTNASANKLIVVIISQDAELDLQRANELKHDITRQWSNLNESPNTSLNILLSHRDFGNIIGHWTIWTLIKRISQLKCEWILFCEPNTVVNVKSLLGLLSTYNVNEDHFIGKALYDRSPTIIHHFGAYDIVDRNGRFGYPDFAAGFVVSFSIVTRLREELSKLKTDFSIDAKHELAVMIRKLGVSLQDSGDRFCTTKSNQLSCVTHYVTPTFDQCSYPINEENVYFAVKTYFSNHKTRVVVIKRTWVKSVKYVEFFSNMTDFYIPTIDLGIANTERGHCQKTLAILEHFVTNIDLNMIHWIVIADDDTLLNPKRLYRLLSCYDYNRPLIIGERYGYGFSIDGNSGYDYPTGGAGMVFTVAAVQQLIASCRCPAIDSPDDMIIGLCARSLQIPIIHSSAFHQARPDDYSSEYLQRDQPISFHKFEDIDPYAVYVNYLSDNDDYVNDSTHRHHTEL